MNKAQN